MTDQEGEYVCGYEGILGQAVNLLAIFGAIALVGFIYEGVHRLFFRRK